MFSQTPTFEKSRKFRLSSASFTNIEDRHDNFDTRQEQIYLRIKSHSKENKYNKAVSFLNTSYTKSKIEAAPRIPMLRPLPKIKPKERSEKLTPSEIIELKKRYFGKEKMKKGEIAEMFYGNRSPFFNVDDTSVINKFYKEEFNTKLKEIILTRPQFILKLLNSKEISDDEVMEYFSLTSLSLVWTDEMEKIYRKVNYNEIVSYSNMLRTTYFLINIGFHKVLRTKFEEKHCISLGEVKEDEIRELSFIFDKIRKFPKKEIFKAYMKIEKIFQTRDKILNDLINTARKNYYSANVKLYRLSQSQNAEIMMKTLNKEIQKSESCKKIVFETRKHIKSSGHRSYSCKKINVKNIKFLDGLKQTKSYVLTLVEQNRKFFESGNFNWRVFIKESKESRYVINFMVMRIQSLFKGVMTRLLLSKIKKSVNVVIVRLKKYMVNKQIVMSLFLQNLFLKSSKYENRVQYKFFKSYVHLLCMNRINLGIHLFEKDKEIIKNCYERYYGSKAKIFPSLPTIIKTHALLNYFEHIAFNFFLERNNY